VHYLTLRYLYSQLTAIELDWQTEVHLQLWT